MAIRKAEETLLSAEFECSQSTFWKKQELKFGPKETATWLSLYHSSKSQKQEQLRVGSLWVGGECFEVWVEQEPETRESSKHGESRVHHMTKNKTELTKRI